MPRLRWSRLTKGRVPHVSRTPHTFGDHMPQRQRWRPPADSHLHGCRPGDDAAACGEGGHCDREHRDWRHRDCGSLVRTDYDRGRVGAARSPRSGGWPSGSVFQLAGWRSGPSPSVGPRLGSNMRSVAAHSATRLSTLDDAIKRPWSSSGNGLGLFACRRHAGDLRSPLPSLSRRGRAEHNDRRSLDS